MMFLKTIGEHHGCSPSQVDALTGGGHRPKHAPYLRDRYAQYVALFNIMLIKNFATRGKLRLDKNLTEALGWFYVVL